MAASTLHTAHLVHLALVHLLTPPVLALDLLRVRLPFGQEADNVDRVVGIAMSAELALNVLVAQHAHLGREEFAMRAQKATVQRNRGQQCWRDLLQPGRLGTHP